MDMYKFSDHGNSESYLIQGTRSNPHLTNPVIEQVEAMYNEGAPEFVVDQGLYYATATGYGYYCTGFESPGEWDDHRRIFGQDGPDIQYPGAQTESLPYVYYTPSYGYAQSLYNPYNPYIPGAMIGVDGPVIGGQQYYTIPQYQNPVSSPGYMPFVVQPDIPSNSSPDLLDTGASIVNDDRSSKQNIPSASSFPRNTMKHPSNQSNSFNRVSEGLRTYVGPYKQTVPHGNVSSGGFPAPASNVLKGRSASGSIQAIDNLSNEKAHSHRNQLKATVGNGLSDFRSSAQGRAVMDKFRPSAQGRTHSDISGSPDALTEQNRGPRTNRPKTQLAVKAYTTKAGDSNAQGNIIIYTDQYNKDDFPVDYTSAKFFVIKSYSEDDVHKSIKYGVWSSTPHGNKKLQSAYEDAQKKAAGEPRASPVFLFFSVNASGQFCGVAEMIGPVDFHKDMDFWQQDKWSGSFPVKWHIIKDVPNTNFRHIILENNENKPVTNSRDTQEIMFKQGLEMLKLFKNHTLKTSLLDDFMYYENRQKIMQEEKARLLVKTFGSPFFVTALDPPRKINSAAERTPIGDHKSTKDSDPTIKEKLGTAAESLSSFVATNDSTDTKNSESPAADAEDDVPTLKIGSLSINPKQQTDSNQLVSAVAARPDSVDVVTVGSMPIMVNGFAQSSGYLTVGTIPLDPRALLLEKEPTFTKGG